MHSALASLSSSTEKKWQLGQTRIKTSEVAKIESLFLIIALTGERARDRGWTEFPSDTMVLERTQSDNGKWCC